jgi:hypothetical protein
MLRLIWRYDRTSGWVSNHTLHVSLSGDSHVHSRPLWLEFGRCPRKNYFTCRTGERWFLSSGLLSDCVTLCNGLNIWTCWSELSSASNTTHLRKWFINFLLKLQDPASQGPHLLVNAFNALLIAEVIVEACLWWQLLVDYYWLLWSHLLSAGIAWLGYVQIWRWSDISYACRSSGY